MTKVAVTVLMTLTRHATFSPFQTALTNVLIGCRRCQPFCSSKDHCQQEGSIGSALGSPVLLRRAGSRT